MSNVKGPVYVKFNYGFSSVNLDFGNYVLYTCKILMNFSASLPDFESNNIRVVSTLVTKKGIPKAMQVITYATMDYKEHKSMKKEIGRFLHKHAISKLDSKYAYAYDTIDEAYGDMELTIPQPLNTLNWDDIDISSLPELH